MSTWLLRRCDLVVTFDGDVPGTGREIVGGDVLVDGGIIAAVGRDLDPAGCERVVDGTGLVVLPGLINAHQHLYQGAVRAVPDLERAPIGPWLGRLGAILVEHGWAQDRTWLAHVVDSPAHEMAEMADAGVEQVAHLPAPDLRMGWGTAPMRDLLDAGVSVGFGTTGSASNDGADLLGDLHLAALAHRSADPGDPERWPTARELLWAATRGSAACLGRDDLGAIAPAMQADLAAWDLRTVDRVGVHDPVAGLTMTGLSSRAALVAVDGRLAVEDGAPTTLDIGRVASRAHMAVPALP